MARKAIPTDLYSPVWLPLFSFSPDVENHEAVGRLRDLGVDEVWFRRLRTESQEFFTDVGRVVANKGTAVTVTWFKQVRDLCHALAIAIDPEVQRVAGPNDDDPESDLREAVADGELVIDVVVSFRKGGFISADVKYPSVECDSIATRE
jgi:hypothetical protein